MKKYIAITWGYLVEIILAGFIYGLLVWIVSSKSIVHFWCSTWIAWATVCGLMFGAAITMFGVLFNMMTTDFGGYLTSRKADGVFTTAYGYAIAVTLTAIVAFVIAGTVSEPIAAHAAGFLLTLSIVNVYTMVVNAKALLRMHALFQKIKRRMEQESDGTYGGQASEE